jgi:hypothetical protein
MLGTLAAPAGGLAGGGLLGGAQAATQASPATDQA